MEEISNFINCDVFRPQIYIVVCFAPQDLLKISPILGIAKRELPLKHSGRAQWYIQRAWRFLCKFCSRVHWKNEDELVLLIHSFTDPLLIDINSLIAQEFVS